MWSSACAGNFNLGGEQSGHLVLSDYATTGDGLIGGLQFLAAMVETGKKASELARVFEPVIRVMGEAEDTGLLDRVLTASFRTCTARPDDGPERSDELVADIPDCHSQNSKSGARSYLATAWSRLTAGYNRPKQARSFANDQEIVFQIA